MFFERPQRPCLSADDVEGLATLYPDCSPQAITRVVCTYSMVKVAVLAAPELATRGWSDCI